MWKDPEVWEVSSLLRSLSRLNRLNPTALTIQLAHLSHPGPVMLLQILCSTAFSCSYFSPFSQDPRDHFLFPGHLCNLLFLSLLEEGWMEKSKGPCFCSTSHHAVYVFPSYMMCTQFLCPSHLLPCHCVSTSLPVVTVLALIVDLGFSSLSSLSLLQQMSHAGSLWRAQLLHGASNNTAATTKP